MPAWTVLLFLGLATYRLTRLVVKDDFPPALWFRDRIAGGWRPLSRKELETAGLPAPGDWSAVIAGLGQTEYRDGAYRRYVTRASWSPAWLADLVSCPWCASGWISLALTAYTVAVPWPGSFTWWQAAIVWPAVWGAGSLLASKEWA